MTNNSYIEQLFYVLCISYNLKSFNNIIIYTLSTIDSNHDYNTKSLKIIIQKYKYIFIKKLWKIFFESKIVQ